MFSIVLCSYKRDLQSSDECILLILKPSQFDRVSAHCFDCVIEAKGGWIIFIAELVYEPNSFTPWPSSYYECFNSFKHFGQKKCDFVIFDMHTDMVCACSTFTEYYMSKGNKHHGENEITWIFSAKHITIVSLLTRWPMPFYATHLGMLYGICHTICSMLMEWNKVLLARPPKFLVGRPMSGQRVSIITLFLLQTPLKVTTVLIKIGLKTVLHKY